MACEENVRIFTDHRNLLFIFYPSSTEPSVALHDVLKVIRWALYLSTVSYIIEQLHADLNFLRTCLNDRSGDIGRVSHKLAAFKN